MAPTCGVARLSELFAFGPLWCSILPQFSRVTFRCATFLTFMTRNVMKLKKIKTDPFPSLLFAGLQLEAHGF